MENKSWYRVIWNKLQFILAPGVHFHSILLCLFSFAAELLLSQYYNFNVRLVLYSFISLLQGKVLYKFLFLLSKVKKKNHLFFWVAGWFFFFFFATSAQGMRGGAILACFPSILPCWPHVLSKSSANPRSVPKCMFASQSILQSW